MFLDDDYLHMMNTELGIELNWRYRELLKIKLLYKDNIDKRIYFGNIYQVLSTEESKYILRSSLPIIYAHWEGYFKGSIRLLNEKLDNLNLDLNKVDNSIISILYKDKHTEKFKEKQILFSNINFDMGSNLDWKRLENLLNIYNFDKKDFENYKEDINNLVKIRNGIAHGENAYHFEYFSDLSKYIEVVNALMCMTRRNIINFFKMKKYYKNT